MRAEQFLRINSAVLELSSVQGLLWTIIARQALFHSCVHPVERAQNFLTHTKFAPGAFDVYTLELDGGCSGPIQYTNTWRYWCPIPGARYYSHSRQLHQNLGWGTKFCCWCFQVAITPLTNCGWIVGVDTERGPAAQYHSFVQKAHPVVWSFEVNECQKIIVVTTRVHPTKSHW